MLDYFNDCFISELEGIQDLKTQMFEVSVKIDELEKTKNLYAFKSSSRKSVFTPTVTDDDGSERGKIIDAQIKDLADVKSSLEIKIRSLEVSLKKLKNRLELLNDAGDAISELALSFGEDPEEDENMADFEFVNHSNEGDVSKHGYNILMLDAFDRTFYSTLIDKSIAGGLSNLNHKLDMLSYLVGTDSERAKRTVKEMKSASKLLADSVSDISASINNNIDTSGSIGVILEDYIMKQREEHPEVLIDADVKCDNFELVLHPVFSINLVKLLDIFFDNVFAHSNGNRVELVVAVNENAISVKMTDNGIGIKKSYMSESPWYSGLHKAQEIVYLLEGSMNVSGDVVKGTQVMFSFPVKVG